MVVGCHIEEMLMKKKSVEHALIVCATNESYKFPSHYVD